MRRKNASGPRENCLIVEDTLFDQKQMMRVANMGSHNLEYHPVITLAEARDALSKQKFSIILLDNNLPDGKGADFALELANHPVWSRIPVIMISDWPSPFMLPKAQAAGVTFIVGKSEFMPNLVDHALSRSRRVH